MMVIKIVMLFVLLAEEKIFWCAVKATLNADDDQSDQRANKDDHQYGDGGKYDRFHTLFVHHDGEERRCADVTMAMIMEEQKKLWCCVTLVTATTAV